MRTNVPRGIYQALRRMRVHVFHGARELVFRWRKLARQDGMASGGGRFSPAPELPSCGRVVLCAYDFVCGWIDDVDATHVDVLINDRLDTRTALSPIEQDVSSPADGRRYVVMPFTRRLGDGDMVAVRLDGRDLAGSPKGIASAITPARTKISDARFHVDVPNGPVENRLCTMAGWITFPAGARDFRFLVNGRPQVTILSMRSDVNQQFKTPSAVSWQFTCDVAALEAAGAKTLRVTGEIDGCSVAERRFDLRLAPIVSRPPLILFMHVPKTAGTSLSISISQQSKLRTYWLYQRGRFTIADQLQNLSPLAFQDTDLVMGHFRFGMHESLGCPCRYVTLLRDPLAFLRSYFFYMKHVQHFLPFADVDLFSAMEQRLDACLDNCFTRYFLGFEIDRVDEAALATAIGNMERHFTFVGFVERMDESVKRLSGVLGVPLDVRRDNRTPDSVESDAIDMGEFAERAAPCILYDKQLYRHAQRLFWS